MLQYLTARYSISYISWLQLAAEYGGCSQCILTSPLIHDYDLNLIIVRIRLSVTTYYHRCLMENHSLLYLATAAPIPLALSCPAANG